jgi:anthranilate/para-aminobenzoate synthase component II
LKKHKEALWSNLNNSRNFHKGHSLWIRKEIAKNLFVMTEEADNAQWIKLLNDTDAQVVQFSIQALEKNSGMIMGKAEDSTSSKAELWRKKYSLY